MKRYGSKRFKDDQFEREYIDYTACLWMCSKENSILVLYYRELTYGLMRLLAP